jgi:hypothetical protein
MYVIPRTPAQRLIALACSLLILIVVYFAVIKPNNNTANRAIDTANQALKQGEQQLNQTVAKSNVGHPGAIPASVTSLTSCIASAGTDTSKIAACDAKFKP